MVHHRGSPRGFAQTPSVHFLVIGVVLWMAISGIHAGSAHTPPVAPGAVGSAAGVGASAIHPFVGPNLSLSPSVGAVGTLVSATGTGFSAGSPVTFSFGGVGVNSTCVADGTGAFPGSSGTPCTFDVPATPGGSDSVRASQGWNSSGIGVGTYPANLAYDSGLGEIFVTNTGSNNVTVLSDSTHAILATIAVGSYPLGIAYDSGFGEIFVANLASGNVSVISDATNTVTATIAVGTSPYTVLYDSAQSTVFVENSGSSNVSVISDATNTVVATVGTGQYSYAMAYDSAMGEVFTASYGSGNVSVISDANNSLVATIPVGTWPFALAYDAGQGTVFVSNIGSNNVSVISDTTNAVAASVGVGSHPFGLAYDSGQGEVFVADYLSNNVSVISDSTNAVVATIPVGIQPYTGIAYDPGRGIVLVANYGSNNVSVISDATNTAVATIPVGGEPMAIAYDSGQGIMFVVNNYPSSVSVISPGNEAVASFTVSSSLAVPTPTGSADVGQTVAVHGDGYGSALLVTNFTLGGFALNCTSALAGSCVGGVLTTDITGSFVASFLVPTITATGSYLLTLSDSGGNSASASLLVYIDPTVTIPSASRGSVDVGQSVTFNSTAQLGAGTFTFAWFGLPPGCSGTVASLVCTPISAGNFTISVKATDANGFSVTSGPLSFVVYADPTVTTPQASVLSGGVDAGQTVSFATNATLGTMTYGTFVWTGLPGGCTGSTAVVTCSGSNLPSGTYSITVTVSDTNGFTSAPSGAMPFTVVEDPVVSALTTTRPSVDLGQQATLAAAASSGTGIYTYRWVGLPLGCSGSSDTILCKPTAAGLFSIQLEATDTNGFVAASAPLSLSVYADPSAELTADWIAFDAGEPVTLTAVAGLGSGNYTYAWTGLPSACSGTTATIVCPLPLAGNYTVSVKITDSNGVAAPSAAIHLTVAPALSIDVTATPSSPASGEAVMFGSNVTGGTGPLTYSWTFGDGSKGAGPSVTHAFGSAGTYSVSLWVNDTGGGAVKHVLNVTVTSSNTVLGVTAGLFWPAIAVIIAVALIVTALVVLGRRRQRSRGTADSDSPGPSEESDADIESTANPTDPTPPPEDLNSA